VTRGRPIRGLFGGFLLGICIDLDLVFSGAVKLQSTLLTVLPLALLVLFLILGIWAPIGRRRLPALTPLPSPLARPVTWPEYAPTEGSTNPGVVPYPSLPRETPPPEDQGPTSSI
jgi:hypothetical protein